MVRLSLQRCDLLPLHLPDREVEETGEPSQGDGGENGSDPSTASAGYGQPTDSGQGEGEGGGGGGGKEDDFHFHYLKVYFIWRFQNFMSNFRAVSDFSLTRRRRRRGRIMISATS